MWVYSKHEKYKDLYRVNKEGIVESKANNKKNWTKLNPSLAQTDYTGKGYYSITWEGVRKRLHVLVCEMFHGKRPTKHHQVNHIDGDRSNNKASNLEWVTAKENIQNALKRGVKFGKDLNGKLNQADIKKMAKLINECHSNVKVAAIMNIDASVVSRFKNKHSKTFFNYHYLLDDEKIKKNPNNKFSNKPKL